MAIFKGSGVALVTPFKENLEVDYEKLRQLADWHVEHGTDAIIVCGTSGEASTLTEEEYLDLVRAIDNAKPVRSHYLFTLATAHQSGIFLSANARHTVFTRVHNL